MTALDLYKKKERKWLRKEVERLKAIPKFDYWMLGILEECAKTEIKRLSSKFPASYVVGQLENRNEFNNFGQLQLIKDRLNEIRTHYDSEIKDGLG